MPKFQPIVLSLLIAYASATGCYPAYSPENIKNYVEGTLVSQVVTVTTPIAWTACEVSPTCITGWEQTGAITTSSTHNFQCSSPHFCINPGYAPGSIYTNEAWTKEDAQCSGTAVVPPPTSSPTVATTLAPTPKVWSGTGCPKAYVTGALVSPGASVSVTKDGVSLVYTCNTDTTGGWCPMDGYQPGTGLHWNQAWTLSGSCTGTITPTSTPTSVPSTVATLAPTPAVWSGTGCPTTYVAGTSVAPGASVTVTKDGVSLVYLCNADTTGGWCNMEGYQPGTGRAWKMAWTLMGSCTGTLTPTLSPTTRAPTSSPSSSLPNQGGCPSVWTTGVNYREGDLVSKNDMVYQCNGYPMSLFCPMDAYAPLLVSGAWKLAWTTVGPCTGTSAPMTASPTTTLPSSSPTSSPTAYSGTCEYDKIVVTAGPSVPCVHGSSTSCICTAVDVSVNPLGYTCTMPSTVTTPTPTPVTAWSKSINYAAGDVVRVGINRFKCKESPFSGWCSVEAYAPAIGGSVRWTDAWTVDGVCQ